VDQQQRLAYLEAEFDVKRQRAQVARRLDETYLPNPTLAGLIKRGLHKSAADPAFRGWIDREWTDDCDRRRRKKIEEHAAKNAPIIFCQDAPGIRVLELVADEADRELYRGMLGRVVVRGGDGPVCLIGSTPAGFHIRRLDGAEGRESTSFAVGYPGISCLNVCYHFKFSFTSKPDRLGPHSK
jgi:hypothetical protein